MADFTDFAETLEDIDTIVKHHSIKYHEEKDKKEKKEMKMKKKSDHARETEYSKDYSKEFEKRTNMFYKVMRTRKCDPILNMDLDDDYCFKFAEMWDPYTGTREKKDPHGPLCFHPDALIRYYYLNRLKGLWVEPVDEVSGYYEGYYDCHVGAGENIEIQSRGECPEKYLFRVPVQDCYLTPDHNHSFITMGPRLTDDEIKNLETIAETKPKSYKEMFGSERPKISRIKYYYDQAISKTPDISKLITELTVEERNDPEKIMELYYRANRIAVDELIKM